MSGGKSEERGVSVELVLVSYDSAEQVPTCDGRACDARRVHGSADKIG